MIFEHIWIYFQTFVSRVNSKQYVYKYVWSMFIHNKTKYIRIRVWANYMRLFAYCVYNMNWCHFALTYTISPHRYVCFLSALHQEIYVLYMFIFCTNLIQSYQFHTVAIPNKTWMLQCWRELLYWCFDVILNSHCCTTFLCKQWQ